jgi:hypothetical protein
MSLILCFVKYMCIYISYNVSSLNNFDVMDNCGTYNQRYKLKNLNNFIVKKIQYFYGQKETMHKSN